MACKEWAQGRYKADNYTCTYSKQLGKLLILHYRTPIDLYHCHIATDIMDCETFSLSDSEELKKKFSPIIL